MILYQQGGTIPTRQDSINLRNSSLAVQKYFDRPAYQNSARSVGYERQGIDGVNHYNREARNRMSEQFMQVLPNGIITSLLGADTSGMVRRGRMSDYYKPGKNGTYYQKDLENDIIDSNAPFQQFHPDVEPTGYVSVANLDVNDRAYGDRVSMFTYDPVSVTPADMLTPEEEVYRRRKYGNAGLPSKINRVIGNTDTLTHKAIPAKQRADSGWIKTERRPIPGGSWREDIKIDKRGLIRK